MRGRDGDSELEQSSDQDLSPGVSALGLDEDYDESCAKQIALLALMEKTGYNMVQENGQRKYGGPPPDWEGPPPPRGCEVFVGKIPRDLYEDELVPLFERAGHIYEFRLMMEFSGENRGYAFVMYTTREAAQRAIQMLNNHEVRPGKYIGVCVSLDNCRLFISSIPKDKKKEEILEEMKKVTEGVVDVIMYSSSTDKNKNRGFAFVEYESHKAAAMARRKLIPGTFQIWGHSIKVNWAEPERDVDEEVMQRVRVLYVRNLMPSTSEDTLRQEFSRFKPECVERVKKLSDYGFIHYHHRDDALTALATMHGAVIDGATIEVTLAKPASSNREGGASSAASRKYHSRGYLGNSSHGQSTTMTPVGGGVAAGGGAESTMHRESVSIRGLSPRLSGLYYSEHNTDAVARGLDRGLDRGVGGTVLPLFPGTPLTPTSLLLLKQSQICSAQSLLEYFCCKNYWSPPEYHLYSTPGQDGRLLLLFKVVIPSTRITYIPDKLCVLLDDAKELAAQTALWNLDAVVCGGVSSCDPASSPSPPLSAPPPLTWGRPLTPCLPHPFPLSPPPAPSPGQSHRLFLSPPPPAFY